MIYTVGMVTFVRTILIIALVYYGLKLIVKYLFPFFLRRFINKQQEKFHQQSSASGSSQSKPDEKKVSNRDTLGDYVDYEEVE